MSIIMDVGMRSFVVLLEDSKILVLHSQVVQVPMDPPSKTIRMIEIPGMILDGSLLRSSLNIPSQAKGKGKAFHYNSAELPGMSFEWYFGFDPPVECNIVPTSSILFATRVPPPLSGKNTSFGDLRGLGVPMISASSEKRDMQRDHIAPPWDHVAPSSITVNWPRDKISCDKAISLRQAVAVDIHLWGVCK